MICTDKSISLKETFDSDTSVKVARNDWTKKQISISIISSCFHSIARFCCKRSFPFTLKFQYQQRLFLDRLEICQKIYTTGFFGQKFYTLKVVDCNDFYTAGTNFTRPPVVTVAKNLNSECIPSSGNLYKKRRTRPSLNMSHAF